MPDTHHRDAHLIAAALEPWAIREPMLQIIARVLGRHVAGRRASETELQAALVNRETLPQAGGGGAAVLQVYGVLVPRANLLDDISGGTSFENLGHQLDEAMLADAVKTIILDINSPGGSVPGATELHAKILKARRKKAVIAQIQYSGYSAAYWIASAATKIYAAPSAGVGNIGVLTIHEDLSKALEMEGITETYIYAGKYKIDGNSSQPLSAEAKAYLQTRVDAAMEMFVTDISRGRGASKDEIRTGYGQGRDVSAADALAMGMIDGIQTLEETVARALEPSPQASVAAARAAYQMDPLVDTTQEPRPVATVQDRRLDAWLERQALEQITAALGAR